MPDATPHDPAATARRDFLKSSAAIASFPLALGGARAVAMGAPRPGHIAGSGEIKIGLIGCGGRGTGAAAQALRADPGIVLHAMGDVFGDRLDASLAAIRGDVKDAGGDPAQRVRVPENRAFLGFDAGAKVIQSDVDAVLLCEYPHFRPRHIRLAIEAGKHVFAEKPVAVDAPGIRSVLESAALAKQKNLALLCGFCWRHNQGMKATFEQINSGALGQVLAAHTTYHTSTLSRRPRKPEWSDMEFQMRNWWHFTWISGDHIVEQAIHSIDRLSWAFNDKIPLRVSCLGGRAARSGPEHGNVFDHFAAVLEYEGGLRGFHTTRQIDNCPSDNSDYLFAEKGTAEINGWKPVYTLRPLTGQPWKFKGEVTDMYQNEHDALWKSVRDGSPINDGVRSAHSTLLAIAARMAAYTGQTISWDQALNSTEDLSLPRYELGPLETPPIAIPGITKFT